MFPKGLPQEDRRWPLMWSLVSTDTQRALLGLSPQGAMASSVLPAPGGPWDRGGQALFSGALSVWPCWPGDSPDPLTEPKDTEVGAGGS